MSLGLVRIYSSTIYMTMVRVRDTSEIITFISLGLVLIYSSTKYMTMVRLHFHFNYITVTPCSIILGVTKFLSDHKVPISDCQSRKRILSFRVRFMSVANPHTTIFIQDHRRAKNGLSVQA